MRGYRGITTDPGPPPERRSARNPRVVSSDSGIVPGELPVPELTADSPRTASGVGGPARAGASTPPDPPFARGGKRGTPLSKGGKAQAARPVPFPPLRRGGQGGYLGKAPRVCNPMGNCCRRRSARIRLALLCGLALAALGGITSGWYYMRWFRAELNLAEEEASRGHYGLARNRLARLIGH